MTDKELLGLLIGIGLLIAFAAYIAYIYFHPDRFGWLVSSSTAPKSPSLRRVLAADSRGYPKAVWRNKAG